MNEIQKQTQNALTEVTVVTNGKQEAKVGSKQDNQSVQEEKQEETEAEEKPKSKKAELNEAQKQAQAAISYVSVKPVVKK